MKSQLTLKLINAIQVVVYILLPTIMFAPPFPPNPGNTSPNSPIDAGIGFLLVAGASYGIKRLADARKKA